MGSEPRSIVPKLPLFSIPQMPSPEHPGMLTPPFHPLASVPFRWEEEPGKPLPCTTLIPHTGPKCLDLPPRLNKIAKTPSPNTVLDGPDDTTGADHDKSSEIFSSLSFRFVRKFEEGSFDSKSWSPEEGHFGPMVVSEGKRGSKRRGLFRSWGKKNLKLLKGGGKKPVGGGSFVFPSSVDVTDNGEDGESGSSTTRKKMGRKIRRNGSLSSLSQANSHLWEAIYEGFKKAIPWTRKFGKAKSF